MFVMRLIHQKTSLHLALGKLINLFFIASFSLISIFCDESSGLSSIKWIEVIGFSPAKGLMDASGSQDQRILIRIKKSDSERVCVLKRRMEDDGISVRNQYKEAHGRKDLVTCEANNDDGKDQIKCVAGIMGGLRQIGGVMNGLNRR